MPPILPRCALDDDSIEIVPIESDSDFPFNLDDFEYLTLQLSSTYRLPDIAHFKTKNLRIWGGIVDIQHLPVDCNSIEIGDAFVENSSETECKSCLELKLCFPKLCMSRQDIERAFPYADVKFWEYK